MTLQELKIDFSNQLEGVHAPEEITSFFYILCDFYLKYSRFQVSLNAMDTISETQSRNFKVAIERLKTHEPIQYILGETEFFGLRFRVSQHTLIPRPETEELVAWIISDIDNRDANCSILDIGTGSGCVAVTLANHFKNASIIGMDISEEAIQIAIANAATLHVSVSFIAQDILKTEKLSERYDVIVSNPPYVRELEKEAMKSNVLDYEPEMALFVSNEDPLLFYRKIAQLAWEDLKERGWLYFEINEYLGVEMTALLSKIGFKKIALKNDFRGVPRMIKCQKI